MKPFLSGLCVAAVFGVMAQHAATGFLHDYYEGQSPVLLVELDRWINDLFIAPLGRGITYYVFAALGVVLGTTVFLRGLAARRRGSAQRHSTF